MYVGFRVLLVLIVYVSFDRFVISLLLLNLGLVDHCLTFWCLLGFCLLVAIALRCFGFNGIGVRCLFAVALI